MNQNVKEFIEQNIDLIDQHDWPAVFNKWYTKYYMFDKTADNLQLRELFDVLQEIGILPHEHQEAREDLITDYFNDYIDNSIFENAQTVTAVGAINSLHSCLGVSLIALKAHFVDMCRQRGFKVDPYSTNGGRFILP